MTPLPNPPPLALDGSVHEGGGQIVRNAFALAATVGRPLTVTSIRAGRPKPGLRPQHVAGLRLVATLSAGATLAGCAVGSTELSFTPGKLTAGSFTADAGTAGSTMLMAQAALPPALLASGGSGGGLTTVLDLRGGTDAAMAPPADFASSVLLPTLHRCCGVDVRLEVVRRGFYPRGGGHARLTVRALLPGQALAPLVLERAPGDGIATITIAAVHAGRVRAEAARAAAEALAAALRERAGASPIPPPTISIIISPAPAAAAVGDGGSVTAIAATRAGLLFGASAPLTPKDDAPALGARLGADLAEDAQLSSPSPSASVDRWLADQVVIFAALAGGVSRWTTAGPPTPHARAAMEVATAVTGASFTVRQGGGGWTVECAGAGVPAGQQQ